mmetsp:Transcript_18306/g.36861  ORF Transcript_18306/g.36861 Transcript_18306/m.36861 type:complete len:103 (-) Transcript_18306:1966-2274(-)
MSATRVTSPVTYTTAVAKEVMALHHHDCRQPQHKKKSVARLLKSGQKVFPISSSDKKDTTKRFPKGIVGLRDYPTRALSLGTKFTHEHFSLAGIPSSTHVTV